MKILLATGLYPPEVGGPATYTKLLEKELPKHAISVVVLPFSRVRSLPPGLRHIAYFFYCWRYARTVDVIYAQDAVSVGLSAVLVAWCVRLPCVVRVPGDYAWEQGVQRFGVGDSIDAFQQKRYGLSVELLRYVQRFVLRRARAVVVPSEYLKHIVIGWGIPSERITRIYSSITLPIPESVERPGGFLVVSSGRSVPWKGFAALQQVVERESNWHFLLLQNLLREKALGWVKVADVFVLNSTYEGLSHALVEAMLLGTPVVATAVGGNPELIENGVDGILIPPGDEAALYAALKEVAADKAAARARAARARVKAAQFSIETAVTQLVQLLQRL